MVLYWQLLHVEQRGVRQETGNTVCAALVLLQVVRCFEDDDIVHVSGKVGTVWSGQQLLVVCKGLCQGGHCLGFLISTLTEDWQLFKSDPAEEQHVVSTRAATTLAHDSVITPFEPYHHAMTCRLTHWMTSM